MQRITLVLAAFLLLCAIVAAQTPPDITSFSMQANTARMGWTPAGTGYAYDVLFRPQ